MFPRILSILRLGYSSLAATPLNANLSFITASVLWIGSLAAILRFNDYLLGLGSNTGNSWKEYLKWLRLYACCRPGVRVKGFIRARHLMIKMVSDDLLFCVGSRSR